MAEARHWAGLVILQRAEEVARLYGADQLSHRTMLELLGLRGERNPPLVFESTPSRQPNMIADAWANSMAAAMRIVNGREGRGIVVVDSLTGVDAE